MCISTDNISLLVLKIFSSPSGIGQNYNHFHFQGLSSLKTHEGSEPSGRRSGWCTVTARDSSGSVPFENRKVLFSWLVGTSPLSFQMTSNIRISLQKVGREACSFPCVSVSFITRRFPYLKHRMWQRHRTPTCQGYPVKLFGSFHTVWISNFILF